MTTHLFGAGYSGAFDTLYQDKDYNAETDLIESTFRQYADTPIKTVIDFGCGTGNHAIRLARRGYQVVGVDMSEEMLAAAWVKTGSLPPLTEINFFCGDMREIRLDQTFDAALTMFNVLGYQVENDALEGSLATVRSHLKTGGLFVFDVWYGPAVLNIRPSSRIKELRMGDTRLIRAANPTLDTYHQTCQLEYRILRFEGDRLAGETHEAHVVRYFFAQELRYFLTKAGFELINLCAFPNVEQRPDETTWNVMGIAKAV